MTLREKIAACIAAGSTSDDAATLIVAMLDDMLDLRGEGWLSDDRGFTHALQRQGSARWLAIQKENRA